MIDLEKEREAFEDQWKKNGYFHFNLERKNGEERYSHRHVNFSFKFWCQRAELAQAEINKLKQKLEKLESGEFVLVPTSDLQTWYLDKYEGLWPDKDGIDGGLSEIDIGEVYEVKKQKQYSIEIPSVFVTLPWVDGEFGEWQEYATKEEAEKVAEHCKQMFDADGV